MARKSFQRHVRIISTLGPASRRKETVYKMAVAGMDNVRLNFSHGDHSQHKKLIDTVRAVNEEFGTDIKIIQDLEGYRVRIGQLKQNITIKDEENVLMSSEVRRDDVIPLDSGINMRDVKRGMNVFVDDGKIHLRVMSVTGKIARLHAIYGGVVKSKKGVNIPEFKFQDNILTDKDKDDISFGIENEVDYVAQSFVRNKQDIVRVAKLVKPHLPECNILAKIENQQGVNNIDSIIESCEGILIARGDMGVSLPIYKVPLIQKDIIQRCLRKKKLAITATQMLESMTEHSRPTRAEVSDVANAILDGTDYVMLSGETAVGRFPVKCVRMMRHIIEYTEKNR